MADQYLSNLSITWNQGATTYNAVKIDVTDTASAADSKLMDLQVGSATKLKVDKSGNQTLTSSDTGATAGPVLTLHRDSSSPAASDIMGKVLFRGEDSGGAAEDYAEIYATIVDTTATSEDGSLLGRVKVAGTMTTRWTATAAGVTLTGVVDIPDGTVGAPSLAFTADGDTGFYRIGANEIGLSAGATKVFGSTATATTLPLATTLGSTLGVTGAATLSSSLGVTGATTLSGGLSVSGGVLTSANSIRAADGLVGFPSVSFTSDTDTGVYRIGADNIGIAAGGTKVFDSTASATILPLATTIGGAATLSSTLGVSGATTLSSTLGVTGAASLSSTLGVTGVASFANGTAGAPALTFTSDPDTGVYRIGANNIGLAAGATKVFDATASAITLPLATTVSGAATLSSTLGVTGATTLSSTLGVTGVASFADGNAAAPGIAFSGDTDTGIARIGIDRIGISAGGTYVFDSTATATILPRATTIAGAATLSSTLGVTGATTLSGGATVSGGVLTASNSIRAADGLVSFPSVSFTSDTDTGMYRIGANEVGLSAGGTKVFGSTATATTLPLPTTISGATTLGSTLGVTGATTLSSTLGVTGHATLSSGATVSTGALTVSSVIRAADGLLGFPSVSFTSDTNTGLYLIGADNIGIVAGGTRVFESTATSTTIPKATTIGGVLTASSAIRASDGVVGTPSISFSDDTDTGFYRTGADAVSYVSGGSALYAMNEVLHYSSQSLTASQMGQVRRNIESANFSARLSANQTSISAGVATKVTFDTEDWDDGSYFDTTNNRWTPHAGTYRVTASLTVSNVEDGYRYAVSIYKSGSVHRTKYIHAAATTNMNVDVTAIVQASGTDYFEVYVTAEGTTSKTIVADTARTYFCGEQL